MADLLIVEDQEDIHLMVKEALQQAGYSSQSAYSGTEAQLLLKHESYRLILLDLMLAGMSGEELISWVRQDSQVPILVMSAKDSISSKVEVLGLGADDYLVKPFDLEELIARVQVLLKRTATGPSPAQTNASFEGLSYDPANHTFSYQDSYLSLTPLENRILRLLFQSPQRIFSKQEIYEYAWEEDYFGEDQTINVHISNLRKKLEAASQKEWIQTIWGIGFRLMKK